MRALVRALVPLVFIACGTSTPDGAGAAGAPATDRDEAAPAPGSGSPPAPSPSSSSSSPPPAAAPDAGASIDAAVATASCRSTIPAGATRAPALPTYAGACPALAVPPARTAITSSGASREFLVFRPATIATGEVLPVVFLWHWLGGDADKMGTILEVQAAADEHRFVGVVPFSKSDALFRWPFEASQSQARVDEETKFFDDMLACVAAALPVDKECVSTAGVSAGALWSSQLAVARSERLASVVSLSGGVGDVVRDWSTTKHRLPFLVLWGGPDDVYPSSFPIVNFEKASRRLETALDADGHFITECTHNCGHTVPPFDPPPPGGLKFDMLWRFVLDHPYWLPAGKSPYAGKPLPSAFPAWCANGKGNAVPRPANAACP